ncbi:MAG: 3-hydroxyacyl-CoA dehydrogenase/enoyl-CoA hydratase family protein, partial [Deltaproteobacteria bacterium]
MSTENIRKVAIIGAGLMGHGIAQVFAQAGYQVSMQSRREKSVQQAFERIEANLQTLVESGLVEEAPSQILARIEGTTNMNEAAENADFVVEAVPEVLSVKKEVFKNLDKICPEHTILASNTSGLSITEIASATNRPEKVVGTHFWNPPHLVQAVEIVRGLKTSDNTVKITQELLVKVGKKPVIISKDIFGQVGIRILYAMLREAISLLEKDVASVEDIDVVVREALGTRLSVMGLFEMADLSGLD